MVGNIGIGIANAIGFKHINKGGGNISYPGLIAAWSAKGKSNDDEDRAILKDLTGNGHDITLNGFAFSKGSGYGKYEVDFTTDFREQDKNTLTITKNIVKNTPKYKGGWLMMRKTYNTPSFKVLLTGLSNDGGYVSYGYKKDKDSSWSEFRLKNNEINVLPAHISDEVGQGFIYHYGKEGYREITLELIPEYPDALVFDGVDDYGINENMPILTDYTVIVKRIIMKNARGAVISKSYTVNQGSFIFEFTTGHQTYSFGNINYISIYDKNISWQNIDSYNQKQILVGEGIDGNDIYIGKIRKSHPEELNMAFYSAYLFDRSLDEQEIKAFIRKYIDPEYLLPSEPYLVLNQGKLNINKLK